MPSPEPQPDSSKTARDVTARLNYDPDEIQWFVLRDLKRANALQPAWKQLGASGFEVFTPMHWRIFENQGRKQRRFVPVISDLVFVRSSRSALDPVIARTETLQYRFAKNCKGRPMHVPDTDMQRFIVAVENLDKTVYYSPGELTAEKVGKRVRIIGGRLDGYEGNLLSLRGTRTRRLIVELPGLVAASVEINPEYIQIL